MEKFRISNDLSIFWSITNKDGSPYTLSDKTVRLFVTHPRGRVEVTQDITIQDNVICWLFRGSRQRYLGTYRITAEIQATPADRTIRKDIPEAFELVSSTQYEQTEIGRPDISEEGELTLATSLDIFQIKPIIPQVGPNRNWWVDGADTGKSSVGLTAYEFAKEQGYEGTEEEYAAECLAVPMLNEESRTATAEAIEATENSIAQQEEVSSYMKDVAKPTIERATAAALNAEQVAADIRSEADAVLEEVDAAIESVNEAAESANGAASNAKSAATRAEAEADRVESNLSQINSYMSGTVNPAVTSASNATAAATTASARANDAAASAEDAAGHAEAGAVAANNAAASANNAAASVNEAKDAATTAAGRAETAASSADAAAAKANTATEGANAAANAATEAAAGVDEKIESSLAEVDTKLTELSADISKTNAEIVGGTFQLIKGSYVATGGAIVNDGSAFRTEYIDVSTTFKVKGRGSFYGNGLVLAFFDENKIFIDEGWIRGGDGNPLKEFDSYIPSAAKYAVVSAYGAANAELSFIQTSGLIGLAKKDVRKNVLVFGDSITETKAITFASEGNPYSLTYSTYGTNWVDYFTKQQNGIVKFNDIRNYAKSGARFIKHSGLTDARQFIGFQIDEAIADLNAPADGYFYGKSFEPDIIVVSMGTNDYDTASSTSYDDAMARSVIASGGYIDVDATIDNLRNTIFAESVRKAFMRIRKQFPLAKMYMCLPLQRAWEEFPEGILDCLRKMSARYGFTIIDCYGESGITRDFQSVYLRDGLHPNDKGKEVMGRYIVNRILADNHY